jgi:type IV secretory pathway component VirB8
MMYKAKVAICSEIRKKHLTQSEHLVKFWMLKLVVCRETARLLKVKNRASYI